MEGGGVLSGAICSSKVVTLVIRSLRDGVLEVAYSGVRR